MSGTDRLTTAINAKLAADRAFRRELLETKREGVSVNEIARQVHAAGIASRPTVRQWLGAESLRERAERALNASGYANDVALSEVRRGGAVTLQISPWLTDFTRLRAAHVIEEQLRKHGMYVAFPGTEDPVLESVKALSRGDVVEIAST